MKNQERKVRYVPPELKWESVPRRRFTATFDNVLLSLDLTAGADNLNAVVTAWKTPIAKHDAAVAFVEEKIAQGEAWHPDVLKFVLYDGTAAVPSALHSGRYRRVLTSPTKSERISESTSRSVCESHDHSFCVFVPRKFKICRENDYSIKFRRIAVQLSIFWDRTRGIKIRTH